MERAPCTPQQFKRLFALDDAACKEAIRIFGVSQEQVDAPAASSPRSAMADDDLSEIESWKLRRDEGLQLASGAMKLQNHAKRKNSEYPGGMQFPFGHGHGGGVF
jgi:hypothetical protein